METEMMTEKVLVKKEKLAVNIEQLIETDLSLADYFGDIVKILGLTASTNIFSSVITADKAVIDGSVTLRMLYIDSDGKTEAAECNVPFNRSTDIKNVSDSDNLTVECISEQINCRAVNPRRAEMRGSVTLRVTVCGTCECSLVADAPDGFCHMLKSSCEGYLLQGIANRNFNIGIKGASGDRLRNARICRVSMLTTVNETKTIKNKMMIRGNASATVVYVTPDGNFSCDRITESFNQIIEMDGIDEDSVCCVTLKTVSADGRITPDSPQSPPSIEVAATVCARVSAFRKGVINCVDEAYSSTHELVCKSDTVRFVTAVQKLCENHAVTSKFDFSSCNIESVDDAAVRRIKYTCLRDGDDIVINGNINYGIILTTKDKDRMYFERTADFEYRKRPGISDDETELNPVISINAVSFSADGENCASVTTELRIDGFIYSCRNITGLVSTEKGAERKRNETDCIFTVYFAAKGERLWDIAKNHYTSEANIRSMNDISGDTLDADCMLIFEQE